MDSLFRGLDFVVVYLDDILVAIRHEAEHLKHLRERFSLLEQHGLMVNPKECHFGKNEFDFLGHRINQTGVSPRPGKVNAIKPFPKPTNVNQPNQQRIERIFRHGKLLPPVHAKRRTNNGNTIRRHFRSIMVACIM